MNESYEDYPQRNHMDNLPSQSFFMHLPHSVDKMPAYTTHKAPQVHKQPVPASSYHQTKKPPDQIERIRSTPNL